MLSTGSQVSQSTNEHFSCEPIKCIPAWMSMNNTVSEADDSWSKGKKVKTISQKKYFQLHSKCF